MRTCFRQIWTAFLAVAGAAPLPVAAWAGDFSDALGPFGQGWYVAGKGGPTFSSLSGVRTASGTPGSVQDSSSSNIIGSFGMAAGYEWMYGFHIPLRTELEFMNRTEVTYDASPLLAGAPSGALASTAQNVTTMLKAYLHFPVGSEMWWPFISGGIGWSHNTAKSQYTPTGGTPMKYRQSTDDLAWSAGIGATFKLGPQVMNDIEFRYVDLGKVNWGLPAGTNIQENKTGGFSAFEISFALRYMF